MSAGKTRKDAPKWPNVPLFLTASSKDDLVDPAGVKEFYDKVSDDVNHVVMETEIGGKRIISKPIGDPIPRIC